MFLCAQIHNVSSLAKKLCPKGLSVFEVTDLANHMVPSLERTNVRYY